MAKSTPDVGTEVVEGSYSQPPSCKQRPERYDPEETEKHRIAAAIAFVAIMIVVGLPLWWKTTEVYRVWLPYSRIEALKTLDVRIELRIFVVGSDEVRGTKLADDLHKLFNDSLLFRANISVETNVRGVDNVAISEDFDSVTVKHTGVGEICLLEVKNSPKLTHNKILVGTKRTVYFSPNTEASELYEVLQRWWLREASLTRMMNAMITPTEVDQDAAGRRRVPAAKEYDILITAINNDPEKLHLKWNLAKTVQDYLEPFLSKLSSLATFKVKSQWLYYVSLEVHPKLVTQTATMGQHYALAEELLPHIITPLEKKLASHVSQNRCLNFVVYIPPCSAAPLHIYRKQGTRAATTLDAFLSPRWGGIMIHNPPNNICQESDVVEPVVVSPDSPAIMSIILEQLRLLLGVPKREKIRSVNVVAGTSHHLSEWELDFLLRVRTLEQFTSAKITLLSLSQLLGEISNIVINDDVGESIYDAVDQVENVAELLQLGYLEDAFNASKKAFLSSESAFTDPSLLALLYFPDDQKYAVYIPLFLPVMIPVFMSLKNIYRFFKNSKTVKVKDD
ncbi:GPI transamidase component PIG-S isoform X2 [Bacillus rossius redtenbacheri]